jgi:Growth-Arrest-Specific Protein 2 Domain
MRLDRENDGVYRFGSKRAFIKLADSDCLIIRVGGGFMNMEEFVEQYCNPLYPETPLANNINTGNVPSPQKYQTQKKRSQQAIMPASLPLTASQKLSDISRIQ